MSDDAPQPHLDLRQENDAQSEAEHDRQKQEEQDALAKLYQQSAWSTDPHGVMLEDSPSWRALSGQTFEESRGLGWRNAVHPDDLEAISEIWQQGLETASPIELEYRVKNSSGEWRWLLSKGVPLLDSAGKVRKWVGVTSDVSRRKSAELAQSESEERFRNLADNISQLAWMADKEGWIFWYNRRWYEYTGTNITQMEGWGWRSVHHPEHVERVVKLFRHHMHSGEPWEDTFPLRSAQGEYRWFLSRALPIRDDNGEVVRWFGTNTDIDEQRKAEEALRLADKRKDEFIATLAHELRNPLAPIRTGLEVMKAAMDKPDMLEKLRQTMERQTLQLVSLIDDLLDASRVTRGKLVLRFDQVELTEVVQSALESTQGLVEQAGHQLTVDLPDEPLYLFADQHRLTQILSNLLNNACRYTPPGGELKLSAHAEDNLLALTVQDNGLGIPEECLSSIFEMFNQIQRPKEQGYGGLGIGLTLVHSLVVQHGGTISAHSDGDGQGSRFEARLPIVMEAAAPDQRPEGSDFTESTRSCRVLVVDDNVDAAESLAQMVSLMGHEVRSVHNGPSALDLGAEFQPEIILMDIGMPGMNGYEAARRIREQSWGAQKDVALIAVTGWGQEEARQLALDAGFDFHVVKGADPQIFSRLFAQILSYNC